VRGARFLLVVLIAAGTGQIALAVSEPLKIAIQCRQKSIKNGDFFSVATMIENASKEVQIIHIMTCSYDDHWITGSPFAHVQGSSCESNFLKDVALKSGEVFKRNLYIRVSDPAEEHSTRSLSFRLGFRNGNEGGNRGLVLAPPVWSNPITVQIAE